MKVTLDADGLCIDGEWVPLVSGEFEYWRHNALFWERILDVLKDAGLEMVATFVCWEYHEVAAGDFDFTGRTYPSRDLAGWLDLCHAKGLKVLLRVGPIMDAEWPSRGPALDVCTKERLDPEFLRRTAQYLTALGEIAAPRQIHHGGPIVAVCLDNEIFFPYETDDEVEPTVGSIPVPYNEDVVLSGYRDWLRERDGSLAALNEAWDTSFTTFEEIGTPDYRGDSRAQTLASFDYITVAISTYLRWLTAMCREAGLELPTFINTRPNTEYIDWVQIEDVVDSQGINAYMGAMLPGNQAVVANWYYRLQNARRRMFWAPEFQSGETIGDLDSKFGVQTPAHFRYYNHFAMALGLRGLNWYMFVERDDWHWCPVNPVGKLRPQYEIAKDHVRIMRQLRPDAQVADLGLLWFIEHNQAFMADRYQTWTELQQTWADLDSPREFPRWWSAFGSLLDADADFVLVDPRASEPRLLSHLVYAGPGFVCADDWEAVTAAVEEGSILIAVADLPTNAPSGRLDERLIALNTRLEVTGRVVRAAPAGAAAAALSHGAPSYVVTRPGGLWSSARRRGTSWTVSVINPSESPVEATIELSQAIAQTASSLRVVALVSDTIVQAAGPLPSHVPLPLEPKSVELLRIEPAA